MRNATKIAGGFAVAAIVAATGSAFTGTGLATQAGPSQFVGGTVTQGVTGATLTDITYGNFSDAPANTLARNVTLTFDVNADGKAVSIVLNDDSGIESVCENVAETAPDSNVYTSSCTFAALSVNTIAVTVANPAS